MSKQLVLAHVPVPGDWAERAACRGHNPNDFFPGRGVTVAPIIRKLCARCQVRSDCLEFGVRWPVLGIWGGMAVRQRRRLRVQRQTEAA